MNLRLTSSTSVFHLVGYRFDMGKQEEINPEIVYGNVLKFYQAGDFEKALSNARKIGRQCRDDKIAQECIAICCLQLDRFDDCLDVIDKKKLNLRFEKAYCLYRMNKTIESREVLTKATDLDTREKELLAQIFYRLEQFDDCIEVYEDLIKNVHDDHDEERLSNCAAALAAREQSIEDGKFPQVAKAMFNQDSGVAYELLYNEACGYAACGDFEKAEKLLQNSVKEFTATNEEDMTEEELNQELAIIRSQLGYVLQMKGNTDEALEVFNQTGKAASDDPGTSVTIASNLITLNKSATVFENKRRVKTITAPANRQKLSSVQKKLIDYNISLFYLNNNQVDAGRKGLLDFTNNYPNDSNLLPLLTTAVMVRDKKYKDAVSYLANFPNLDLLVAQVYMQQGNMTETANSLKTCKNKNDLAIVSALVSLYLSFEEVSSAEEIIKQFLASNQNQVKEQKALILRSIAEELIEREMYTRAIEYLEQLLQILGPQSDILAQLITCSSKVDTKLVKKYSENLVSIEQLVGECDVEELSKTSDMFLSNKYALKKAGKAATNQGADNELAKKKKRKKKPRLPKTFDPNVQPDPERWLPKWERSAFKKSRKKKDKHDVGKGTQGGTSGGSVYDHSGPKAQAAQAASSAPDSPKVTSGARPKTAQSKRRGGKKR